MRFREASTERTGEGVRVELSPGGTERSLASRTMSRRQALGLAGGALAGVAALASMPTAAGAARSEGSSAVLKSRGGIPPPLPYYDQGTFGRLFPRLPAFASDSPEVRSALLELGKRGGIMDAGDPPPPANPLIPNPNNPDNLNHTAGITFLGQFLDHDITFDPTSSLLSQVDPTTVPNFRTPAFELDHVYGSGRRASPHLYDLTSPDSIKLLIDEEAPKDLPRNSQNIAIIGDPRNDENLIVAQLHLAFLKFHNAVVDEVLAGGVTNPGAAFTEAQRLVRWHYQWIILNEFLPATVGQGLLDDVLNRGRTINRFAFAGILIHGGPATKVEGNYVGTDASGTQDLGNSSTGVYILGAPNTVVGGTTAGARNIISGNGQNGVTIQGTGAGGSKVEGNNVGTDASGSQDLGNSARGVDISGSNNTIGGTTAGERNVISGNGDCGVLIYGAGATGNKVTGNYVGTDASGTRDLRNSFKAQFSGVRIDSAPDNTVGGTTAGERNTIAFNAEDGFSVIRFDASADASGNRVLSNSIFSNGGLGIDLWGQGENFFANTPTANDPQDTDDGPNRLQNKPALTSATATTVHSGLNSTPGTAFTIQFFSNPPATDEGETFIGQTSVTTDSGGNASFTFSPAQAVALGRTVTATATDPSGNTSEFSAPATVRDAIPPTVTRVVPAEDATGVAPAANVKADFSEAMRRSSLNTTTFRLRRADGMADVAATVTYDPATNRATLNPAADLEPRRSYVATVTSGARDLAGNALDQNRLAAGNQHMTWTFTVGP